MRIQKQVGAKEGKKTYYKFVVVIPEELVKKAGLKAGDEVQGEVRRGEIKLKKK